MWISQATLDALQAAVVDKNEQMATRARGRCDQLRAILALLIDDARFQALPVRHPFRSELSLAPVLGSYSQSVGPVLDWVALSGAVRALLSQEVASSWLRCNRPKLLIEARELLANRDASPFEGVTSTVIGGSASHP